VQAFENEIKRLGITVIYGEQLKSVEPIADGQEKKYRVITNNTFYEADRVIIATGSLSGPKTTMSTGDGYYICKKLGLSIKDTYPALVGFKADPEEIMPEGGVRSLAEISFLLGTEVVAKEYGELQITKDGISGIPVMQASSKVVL